MQDEFDTTSGKYLTFWTDKQLFGIPIADVVQIVQMQEITEIPEFPSYAKGIISLRGSIIPIIDIRLRFHMEEIPYNERTCIIVTNMASALVGVIVDGVDEVSDISDEEISEPPKIAEVASSIYLTGVGKRENKVILLLDTKRILSDGDLEALSQNA